MKAPKRLAKIESLPGQPFPIGPTLTEAGTNFCLFSKHADTVELLLFNHEDDDSPAVTILLDPRRNKTYHYWHVFIPGIRSGQLFGYRIGGPHDETKGHRFNPDHVVLDPYCKAIAKSKSRKNVPLKSVVCDLKTYDWGQDHHPRRPFAQTVIYEMHVAGFTKNPNSGVSKPGTYAGLIEKIPYLKELGISAVELLPVFQFDDHALKPGLRNYWGYIFLCRASRV